MNLWDRAIIFKEMDMCGGSWRTDLFKFLFFKHLILKRASWGMRLVYGWLEMMICLFISLHLIKARVGEQSMIHVANDSLRSPASFRPDFLFGNLRRAHKSSLP